MAGWLDANESVAVGLTVNGDAVEAHVPPRRTLADIAALSDWYCTALGFRITDWLEDKLVFMTTSRYHHQIALAAAPNRGLNHVAYECADIDDFMRATGRAMRLGHRLLWGPPQGRW